MELKIKLYEGTSSRTAELSKQEGIDKACLMQDKNFSNDGNTPEVFIERIRSHFAKKFIEDGKIKEENELTVTVETLTVENFLNEQLRSLKKAANTAKGTKLELIQEAIKAKESAPKKTRVAKEKPTEEEFNNLAIEAKKDVGRTVEFLNYGKNKENHAGVIIGIRKDKRVMGIQYIIALTDEDGKKTGKKLGKVVGSAELSFTSDPVTPAQPSQPEATE